MSAYAQSKVLEMARMAGLEPAAAALTVRGPTIGLHPNDWLRESDSNRRPAAYEAAAGNHSSQSRCQTSA